MPEFVSSLWWTRGFESCGKVILRSLHHWEGAEVVYEFTHSNWTRKSIQYVCKLHNQNLMAATDRSQNGLSFLSYSKWDTKCIDEGMINLILFFGILTSDNSIPSAPNYVLFINPHIRFSYHALRCYWKMFYMFDCHFRNKISVCLGLQTSVKCARPNCSLLS